MGRAFEVRKVAMAKTSAAKSKVYSKYGREIYMAAKSGTPDPETNQNLKRIIEKAKKDQVTADVIKRAIEKAVGIHAKVALPDQSVTRQSTDYHEGFEDACLQWDLIMTDLPHKIMLELAPHLSNKSELKREIKKKIDAKLSGWEAEDIIFIKELIDNA